MYALKNKVQLIGRLGKNPETKETTNGKKYARFSLATNEVYRNAKGERIEETTWHHIILWGKLAEIADTYLEKGKEVLIEGKLLNRSYETKEGLTKYITEVQGREILLLSPMEKQEGIIYRDQQKEESDLPF